MPSRELDIFELTLATRMKKANHKAKLIFQVAYDEQHLAAQARILRRQGYEVTSIFGNEAAKMVLRSRPHYDLFIVGHAALDATRAEMALWLRAAYPQAKILALNPPQCRELDESDYNAEFDAPESWLPLVAAAAS